MIEGQKEGVFLEDATIRLALKGLLEEPHLHWLQSSLLKQKTPEYLPQFIFLHNYIYIYIYIHT